MDNLAVLVAEKCQVARLDLREKIHQFAFLDLLGGVAWKELARRTGTELHEAAAVDAEDAAATPEIRRIQELLGEVDHQCGNEMFRRRHRAWDGFIHHRADR